MVMQQRQYHEQIRVRDREFIEYSFYCSGSVVLEGSGLEAPRGQVVKLGSWFGLEKLSIEYSGRDILLLTSLIHVCHLPRDTGERAPPAKQSAVHAIYLLRRDRMLS